MEKYSQYRDRGVLPFSSCHGFYLTFAAGTGVAPFFPVSTESSKLALPLYLFLFACRVPLLFTAAAVYFLLLSWLPVGSLVRKAALWLMLGIPGIWWIDLQIDGVKRGYVDQSVVLPRC